MTMKTVCLTLVLLALLLGDGRDVVAQGISPDEATRRMTVAEGFEVSLVTFEPLVKQPVCIGPGPLRSRDRPGVAARLVAGGDDDEDFERGHVAGVFETGVAGHPGDKGSSRWPMNFGSPSINEGLPNRRSNWTRKGI